MEQMSSNQIRTAYIMIPEDKQMKKMFAKQIHQRQEKGQLNFEVSIFASQEMWIAW